MKILRRGLLLLMVLLVFCGCSRGEAEEKDVPLSDISAKLMSDLTWVDGPLYQINETAISANYSFGELNLEGCEAYLAATNVTAEEIVVLKLTDKKDLSDVEAVLQKRVESQKKQFENYVPAEVYKLENAVIASHGRYVALIVCDEFDKAGGVFESCFQ